MTFSLLSIIKLKSDSYKDSNFEVGYLVQSYYSKSMCGLVVEEKSCQGWISPLTNAPQRNLQLSFKNLRRGCVTVTKHRKDENFHAAIYLSACSGTFLLQHRLRKHNCSPQMLCRMIYLPGPSKLNSQIKLSGCVLSFKV